MTYIIRNDELYHHGILGQKWGIRRYQNPDGSLTAEGKKRYLTDVKFKYKYDKYAKKQELKRIDKLMKKPTRKLTDDELRERISRKQLESSAEIALPKPQQNANNQNNQSNKGPKDSDGLVKKVVGGIANTAINQVTKNVGSIVAAKIVKNLFNKKDDKEKKDQDNNEKKDKKDKKDDDDKVLLDWLTGDGDKNVTSKYTYELKPSDTSKGKDTVSSILSQYGTIASSSASQWVNSNSTASYINYRDNNRGNYWTVQPSKDNTRWVVSR